MSSESSPRTPASHPLDVVAARDPARHQARLDHLRAHLGDDVEVLTERASLGFQLDLLVFAPTEQHPHYTLATSGISDLPMTVPWGADDYFVELMMGLPADWPGLTPETSAALGDEANYWPIRLLKRVARLAFTTDSYLRWGDSFANEDEEPYATGSPFVGAVLGPAYGYAPQIMYASIPGGMVQYLSIFPVTGGELDHKASPYGGPDALFELFAAADVTSVLDPRRAEVVASAPTWGVHLLLAERPTSVGDALGDALPNLAARLRDSGALSYLYTLEPGKDVRFNTAGRIPARLLADDVERSPIAAQVREVAEKHRGTLTLAPTVPGAGPDQ